MSSTPPSPSPSSNPSSLGGGAPGISPPLGLLTVGGSERSTNRKILRSAWGNSLVFTNGSSPFYRANSTGNKRFVNDSSLVTTFKKHQAINRNYNDPSL